MDSYTSDSYGDRLASIYDRMYNEFPPYPGQIELLSEYACQGLAVELGIGTGRIAIPLANQGVSVFGIDTSEKMLEVLRERSQGLPITSVIGDASRFDLSAAPVPLIYATFNLLFLLRNREAQISFFQSCKSALGSTGKLVIEVFVPRFDEYLPDGASPGYFPSTSAVHVRNIGADYITLFASKNSPDAGIWNFHDIYISQDTVRLFPCVMNYLYPDEIDVIAEVAGMKLTNRFEDWTQRPFTAVSRKHISIYTTI